MVCPKDEGGGRKPQGNLKFSGLQMSISLPLGTGLVNVKFPISPLKFLTQQTILDVKIPTLGELYDVKLPYMFL